MYKLDIKNDNELYSKVCSHCSKFSETFYIIQNKYIFIEKKEHKKS